MAGIDKTYTDSYEEYVEFMDWISGRKVTFFNGHSELLENYLCNFWEEEDFDGAELPIMNTPVWMDVYLIQNCPIPFVINRMKEVHSRHFEFFSKLEFPVKLPEGLERNRKIVIKNNSNTKLPLYNKTRSKHRWRLQLDLDSEYRYDWWYDTGSKVWSSFDMYYPSDTQTSHHSTVRSLIRFIRNQYLPVGMKFILFGKYIGEEYSVTIK